MEILEYGNPKNDKIILIHGFQSPYQLWNDYIDYYKNDYCVIVPILAGHNINENDDFVSFDICAKELEEKIIEAYYCQNPIIITYYKDGFLIKVKSTIKKIDSIYKTIYLNNEFKLANINQVLFIKFLIFLNF